MRPQHYGHRQRLSPGFPGGRLRASGGGGDTGRLKQRRASSLEPAFQGPASPSFGGGGRMRPWTAGRVLPRFGSANPVGVGRGQHSRVSPTSRLRRRAEIVQGLRCDTEARSRVVEMLDANRISGDLRRRYRVGVTKRSTVSIAQLRAFRPLHLLPINRVVFPGSHPCLISRGASHLDAFSGYPCRT